MNIDEGGRLRSSPQEADSKLYANHVTDNTSTELDDKCHAKYDRVATGCMKSGKYAPRKSLKF